jgi:hypothetical protein
MTAAATLSACLSPGQRIAAKIFSERGRRVTERHLCEEDLAVMLDAAYEFGVGTAVAAPALLAALQDMRAAFGNCGSPRQQAAADRADHALLQATRAGHG